MISIVRKRLACAVNWLLMKSSRWRQADKESVILIRGWLHETGSVTSITDLAELLGFSAAKMYSVMNLTGVPLTIAEFAIICKHFGKDPTEQCMNIFDKCGYDLKPEHAPLLKEAAGGLLQQGRVLRLQVVSAFVEDVHALLGRILAEVLADYGEFRDGQRNAGQVHDAVHFCGRKAQEFRQVSDRGDGTRFVEPASDQNDRLLIGLTPSARFHQEPVYGTGKPFSDNGDHVSGPFFNNVENSSHYILKYQNYSIIC